MGAAVPFDLDRDQLQGKVVAITGGFRGLGGGMATRFGELGMQVAVGGRGVIELPDGVEEGLAAFVDVTQPGTIADFVHLIETELGPIDLWINNAGVLDPVGPARDADPDVVAGALAVNVGGVIAGSSAFARHARNHPSSRRVLVNISSGAARSVYQGWSVYGATKAAVDHFTEIIAAEEPELSCFAVAPGVVDTAMQAQIRTYDEQTFPAVGRFVALHQAGTWNSPAWVADHLAGMLTGAVVPDGVRYRVPDQQQST